MKIRLSVCIIFFVLSIVSATWSKRAGAPIVEPVTCDGITFISPNNDGVREYVEIWNVKTKKKIEELTIFSNSLQPGLEKDVQWVFIEKLECEKDNLIITDEHTRQFQLNIKTRQITRIK